MKKTIVLSISLLIALCSHAQEDKIKTEIQNLEQKSILSIQQKDSSTLSKLWSPTFMVNAPTNMVEKRRAN